MSVKQAEELSQFSIYSWAFISTGSFSTDSTN